MSSGLPDADRAVLDLEKRRYRRAGAKLTAIREELDLGEIAYYQRLNRLLDDPAAALAEPMLVARLRRLRDGRTAARSASR